MMKKAVKPLPTSPTIEDVKKMIEDSKKKSDKMPNHIEEYFAKHEGSKEAFHSRELFKADQENVDIKTDLSIQEIVLINKLLYNNLLLVQKGLKPVYNNFIYQYLRLKISLDRKSRGEFVSVNRGDKVEETTALLSNLSNISNTKK